MQTNPAFMLHQKINMAINTDKDKPKKVESKGLLSSPTKSNSTTQEKAEPIDRTALYVKMIQEKREEIKNGNA